MEKHFGHFAGNTATDFNSTNEIRIDSTVIDWCRIVLIIYMVLVAILAVSGNGIIILVERKNRCKTSTDWLVCFMAANDLTFAIINIPVHISLQLGSWKFLGSDTLCKVHVFVERMTMYSSTLLLCIVALDRYWKTCRPYRKFLTQQRAFRVCIIITLISCAVCLSVPFITAYDGTSRCTSIQLDGAITKTVTSIVSSTYVIMFLIVGICYTKVALTIRRKLIQTNDTGRCKQEKRNKHSAPNRPVENHVSSNTSSVKWLRGRNCKIVPVDSNSCTKEFKDIQMLANGSKEGIFDNSNSDRRLHDQDQKHQASGSVAHAHVKKAKLMDTRVNRTTKIMFAVTLVFLCSWIPTWTVTFYKQLNKTDRSIVGEIFALFGEKAFMLNTFTNPIFYIWLSTVFKQRAKQRIQNLFICRRRS